MSKPIQRRRWLSNATAFLFFLPVISAPAENSKLAFLLKQGDVRDARLDTKGALVAYLAAEKLDPNAIQILLRISGEYSDLVDQTQPPQAAAQMAENALTYAQRAVAIEPANAKAHLCLSIAYGRRCDFVDNRTKLDYANRIRDEALRTLALNPKDDYACHILGRWNYGIANLNPFLKFMAKMIYGGFPPASNEEAARYLKEACELAPQRILHHSELAKVYVALDKIDLARKEWEAILQLPVVDREDMEAKRTAIENLKR